MLPKGLSLHQRMSYLLDLMKRLSLSKGENSTCLTNIIISHILHVCVFSFHILPCKPFYYICLHKLNDLHFSSQFANYFEPTYMLFLTISTPTYCMFLSSKFTFFWNQMWTALTFLSPSIFAFSGLRLKLLSAYLTLNSRFFIIFVLRDLHQNDLF